MENFIIGIAGQSQYTIANGISKRQKEFIEIIRNQRFILPYKTREIVDTFNRGHSRTEAMKKTPGMPWNQSAKMIIITGFNHLLIEA
jgi:TRAP-type mannitol/chloroaromatic compound transport system permease small subunit